MIENSNGARELILSSPITEDLVKRKAAIWFGKDVIYKQYICFLSDVLGQDAPTWLTNKSEDLRHI